MVGGDLSLQTLVDNIGALDFGGMGYAFLVSADGKVLVHPDKALVMKTLADVYPKTRRRSAATSAKCKPMARPIS